MLGKSKYITPLKIWKEEELARDEDKDNRIFRRLHHCSSYSIGNEIEQKEIITRQIFREECRYIKEINDVMELPPPCMFIVKEYVGIVSDRVVCDAFISLVEKINQAIQRLDLCVEEYVKIRKNPVYRDIIDSFMRARALEIVKYECMDQYCGCEDQRIRQITSNCSAYCETIVRSIPGNNSKEACLDELNFYSAYLTETERDNFMYALINKEFGRFHF
jgi:hypothetical protein